MITTVCTVLPVLCTQCCQFGLQVTQVRHKLPLHSCQLCHELLVSQKADMPINLSQTKCRHILYSLLSLFTEPCFLLRLEETCQVDHQNDSEAGQPSHTQHHQEGDPQQQIAKRPENGAYSWVEVCFECTLNLYG